MSELTDNPVNRGLAIGLLTVLTRVVGMLSLRTLEAIRAHGIRVPEG